MILDKTGALDRLDGATLELGCGASKTVPSAIGIDQLEFPGVDLVGDIYEVLAVLPDATVQRTLSAHFFEHVADLELLMAELARVTRQGGVLDVVVPHWSNPYYYSDPTHRTAFGLYSFCYLAESTLFRRWLPSYGQRVEFRLEHVDLRFRSEIATRWGRRIKRVSAGWINQSCFRQELYEENFAHLLPCFEMHFHLTRL